MLMPMPLLRLRPIPGMDTMAMATDPMAMLMHTGLTAMDTTMERGLLMPSPLLRLMPLLPLKLMLMPGTDTMAMATDLMAMDTMDTGLMAMAMDTTERGLLMLPLRLLLLLMLPLRLMLMPGMDTTAMPTGLMPMDTMDIDPMAMATGERSKKHNFYQTAAN